MALEVGIVGLPGAGKTTLFTALTRTGGAGFGKENVGMAIDRRRPARQAGAARGGTQDHARDDQGRRRPGHRPAAPRRPAAGRRDPGGRGRALAGRQSLGRLRDARARASGRRPRPRGAAARASREAGEVRRCVASQGGRAAAGAPDVPRGREQPPRLRGRAAARARAADDQAADHGRERARRHRPEAGSRAGGDVGRGGGRVPRRPFGTRRGRATAA